MTKKEKMTLALKAMGAGMRLMNETIEKEIWEKHANEDSSIMDDVWDILRKELIIGLMEN